MSALNRHNEIDTQLVRYKVYGYHSDPVSGLQSGHWKRLHETPHFKGALARARVLQRQHVYFKIEIRKQYFDLKTKGLKDKCIRIFKGSSV